MMEDIYSEIENYNDEITLQELQNENIELKSEVQKKALDIEKLQKNILQDFDKLASDYKKLEQNYSSLLKTARAEIERKTQMINNLNVEKDMLVINTIQNCNKNILTIRRNMTRDRANSLKQNRSDYDSDAGKSNKNNKDIQKSRKYDPVKNRDEENRLSSIDTVSSTNTDETKKSLNIEKKQAKPELFNKDNGESKENIAKVKSWAENIRSRRKSMPVTSKQLAKFSSDEEFDDKHSPETANRKDRIPKDKSRRVFDRNYNDKQSHKVSETSGIDEKYSSYHESSRETCYKSKHNRYSDKYRSTREKYDPLPRFRKHFSPERSHRRMPKDYLDEHHPRSEYGRHRVLGSPPLERYDSQRRKRDCRPNYDRENPEERHMKRCYETHVLKHKTQSDYDEPNSKRARRDSFNKQMEQDKKQHKENDILEEPMINKKIENLQDISCQSPDYIHPDTHSIHPVREIMNTAATYLEDPRLSSKKYVTKTEDNKVILSTVGGRNVDLQVIETSTWQIPHVDIPEALRRPPGCADEIVREERKPGYPDEIFQEEQPPRYADEIVQEVYMGIDNPVCNLSMESGEIHSETNKPLLDNVTESYFNDYDIVRNSQKDVRDFIDVQQEKIKSLVCSDNPAKPSKCNISKSTDYFSDKEYEKSCQNDARDGKHIVDKQKELEKVGSYENYTKLTRYKIPTINSTIINEESISQKYTANSEQIADEQGTKTENLPHACKNERSRKVAKEYNIIDEKKETEKIIETKYKIPKITESYINDKVSHQNAKEHIVDVQQKETENLPNFGDTVKTNKYKIPKVNKYDKYTASQTAADDVIRPLGRILDEFNATTKANKKCQEKIKKSKKCDANKLSSRRDVDKTVAYENECDIGDQKYKHQINKQREFREVVEGDLELSDETSDNVEINTQENSPKFECIAIPNHEQTDREDSLTKTTDEKCKKDIDDAKKQKTSECSNSIKIKIKRVPEEKTKEPTSEGSKKHKTKKKSHKHKGTLPSHLGTSKETFKSTEIDETTDENMSKEEETPKEIKAKFTDLFGDSSSLITPEDLGVITAPTQSSFPDKYVSILEDAQDAIDVNVKEICKSQTSLINASNDNKKLEVNKTKEEQTTNSIKTYSRKKRSTKRDEEKSVPIVDTEAPHPFVNLIPEAVPQEPDINTVIISTGVQPQIAPDKLVELDARQINNLVHEIQNNDNDIAVRIQQLPQALATSTPYKELKNIHIESDSRVSESNSSSGENKEVRDQVSTPAAQTSISDHQNDADAPDVRIFARRRRKVVKKT